VLITQREESSPLLSTSRKSTRSMAGALGVLAIFAMAAVVIFSTSHTRVALSGDGVVPADQLSFTKGEKVHFAAPKKMGDVAARMQMSAYFDKMGQTMDEAHKKAEKQSTMEARSELNSYFDTLNKQYVQLAQAEKAERKMAHPGKLDHAMGKDAEVMAKDEEVVMSKVSEGATDEVKVEEPKHAKKEEKKEKKEEEPKQAKEAAAAPVAPKKKSSLAITGDKVKVGFYMESMCPGCKYFTTHVLSTLLVDNDFNKMVDFQLYPYGNGQLTGTQIDCQHGAPECEGNQILACLQHHHPITDSDAGFVPTFVCMEGKDGLPKDEFKDCADANGLDTAAQETILACAAGDEGQKLALEAAVATESLNPPHEYAPWVTLNGKPLRDDAYELQEQVCGAYKGSAPAAVCSTSELKSIQQSLHNIGFSICPKDAGVV